MTYTTIQELETLAEVTGINITNLYTMNRDDLELLICIAGDGVDAATTGYEHEAFQEVECYALKIWEYRFGAYAPNVLY